MKAYATDEERIAARRVVRAAWNLRNREVVRKASREWGDRNKVKRKAHYAVNNALRAGTLSKPTTCELCGITATLQGHHDSYLEKDWLTVRWVCLPCHKRIHAEEKE